MAVEELKENVKYVGVVDWDRRLFDSLIPLPEGTSYNSYLVIGSEKCALIDSVDPSMEGEFMQNLEEVGVEAIDYIISQHAEQDHSSAIPAVLKKYPGSKVVTNPRCKGMLMDLLPLSDEDFIEIKDRERLHLGDKTLEFIYAPWVHWPETMLTYLKEDKILFTCDFFGSHIATSDLFVRDESAILRAAKRYYAEIMMPFRTKIKKHLELIEDLEVEIIATSHGAIYDKPGLIMDAYNDWVSENVKNEVIVVYVTMHDSTKKMVDHLVNELTKRNLVVKVYNLTVTDIGELAMDLVDAATIVIGTPTVLTGPHPLAAYAAFLTNILRPKLRFVSIIGSYGWGGRAVEALKSILQNLDVEIIEPIIIRGRPRGDAFKALTQLADEIATKHREIGL